jgi:hypothetical protein
MKKRVFELAKELGISSKEIIDKCAAEGLPNRHALSTVEGYVERYIRQWVAEPRTAARPIPPDILGFDLIAIGDDAHLSVEQKARIFAKIQADLVEVAVLAGLVTKLPGEIDQAGTNNPTRLDGIAKDAGPRMAMPPAERKEAPKPSHPRERAPEKAQPTFDGQASRGRGVRITRTHRPDGTVKETYEEIPAIKLHLAADLHALTELAERITDKIDGVWDRTVALGVKIVDGLGNVVTRVKKKIKEGAGKP